MRGFSALLLRELRSLWVTPLAWVLLATFLVLQGGIFSTMALHFSQMGELSIDGSPLSAYFGRNSLLLALTLLLLCPALSMRALAEERKSGSIELLLSAPIGSSAITLAKYGALLVTYVAMWLPTLLYAVMLRTTGTVDWNVVATSYLGVALVGASHLSLGLLSSALSKSQLVALLLGMTIEFGLFVVGMGEYILDPGPLRDLSAHLSLTTLFEETSKGIVDTRRLVLHTSVTTWALFLTTRLVESWRSE